MTHQEKEALLKRIYALPTEWADAGGSYGKGGPVGSEDAAMLWPEDVIDAINQFADDINVARKDPITGLVPCGCGGKPKYINSYCDDVWMYENYVGCPDCYASSAHISTSKHGYSKAMEAEIKLKIRDNWNTSHGYTAPPLPGATGPDAGEMAPNGDANA